MELNPTADLLSCWNSFESPSQVNTLRVANDASQIDSLSRRRFLLATGTGAAAVTALGDRTDWGGLTSDTDVASPSGTVIAPPLRGEWLVMNPPGHPKLADDFIGMRERRRLPYPVSSVPRHLFHNLPVSEAHGWGRPVYAPVGGTVLEVSNDEPDTDRVNLFGDALDTIVTPPEVTEGDVRPAAGNYVVIEAKEGITFLAHLRRGSVVVTEGMTVVPGQFIGEVGNSGASIFPHLHFQLMSEWTTDLSRIEETLRPYRFYRYERKIGNWLVGHSWKQVHNCLPAQGERFRV